MMRPPAAIWSRSSSSSRKCPKWFTAKLRSRPAAVRWFDIVAMPALSIRRSIGPKRSRRTSAARRMVGRWARSHASTSTRACGAALRTCAATSRASGSLRQSMISRQPARAISSAVTRPMPWVVPVMTASSPATGLSEEGVDEAQRQQLLVCTKQLVLLEFAAHREAAEMRLRTKAPGQIRILVAVTDAGCADVGIDLRKSCLREYIQQRKVHETKRKGAQRTALHTGSVGIGLAEVHITGFEREAVEQPHAGDDLRTQIIVIQGVVYIELAGAEADAEIKAVVRRLGGACSQCEREQCQSCLHVASVVTTILPICWFDSR